MADIDAALQEDGAIALLSAMVADFPELDDCGPLTSDLQYMRLNEIKYLVS